MLTGQEVAVRRSFYKNIFGADRISSSPFPTTLWPVASYDEKIAGLTQRGFKDPQKMITSSPPILGYSFENIDEKIRRARRLGASIDDFINYTIVFIGMSARHYIPILRRCRHLSLEPTPKNVFKIYKSKAF